ncbi:fungal-specific transcription factor domain-containing protein [Xylogone sp. PMI_703]|nr:fungal-specific transcription factor domain-containing protein [Xylogone sp. PMI_703]
MSRRHRVTNGESRGRAGCWTCKEKHVRCTGEQPSCARCQRLKLSCSYELKLLWQEDAVQRGICLGREGRWSKHGKAKKESVKNCSDIFFFSPNVEPIFLNTTYHSFKRRTNDDNSDDPVDSETESLPATTPRSPIPSTFELAFRPQTDKAKQASLSIHPSAPSSLSLSSLPLTLPPREAYLFNYFVSAICPSCSLSPSHNPYLYYITPMSFSYTPLRNAIISVSANELRLTNDRRFEREAWWYKSQALKGLRTSISSGEIGWPFIATILMLCFYDISDGCNESWMTHLRSGMGVMHQLDSNFTESQSLRKFCLMYFAAHHIMGHTTTVLNETDGQYSWLEDDCIEEIDPLMGCSRGLLDIINQISRVTSDITEILSKRPLTGPEIVSFTSTRNEIERSLHTVHQIPPVDSDGKVSDSTYLSQIAEVKRITALLYLHERITTILPPASRSSAAIASYKAGLIDSLIEQITPLRNSPTLLWPLFVLGNASPEDEEHRRFVLERLDAMRRSRNLGSIRLARQLIEDKYRTWDLELEGEMRPKGKWISLA